MNKHDSYCRSYYPALTDPDTCTWCYVIKEVRLDEYFKGWDEGFGIGYGEGYEKARSENSGVEKYKASLLKNITNIEQVFRTVGDYSRAQAYEDIIYLIENFDA